MRTLRLWLLLLLLPLITPLAWAQAGDAVLRADPPCPAHQAMRAAQAESSRDMAKAAKAAKADQASLFKRLAPTHELSTDDALAAALAPPPVRHLPCGDCSACHAVALLPPRWQLAAPDTIEAAPGWHPDLGQGRPEGCELYRPPRG